MGYVSPFETRYEYRLAYFNEVMIFVLIYHLIVFSEEYIKNADGRDYMGYSMSFWTLFVVFANCGLLLVDAIKSARLNCKKKYHKKRMEQHQADKDLTAKKTKPGDSGKPLKLK